MLIDKIIVAKTDFLPADFTGGNIQISVSKYTQTLSIKLVLYFGFNVTRNPISKQIPIQEKDMSTLSSELLIKAKAYRDELLKDKDNESLDLETFVKDSYECSTNANEVVRPNPKDKDNGDRVDSMIDIRKKRLESLLQWFDDELWGFYRKAVNDKLAKIKEPPRTQRKNEAKKRFTALIKEVQKEYKEAEAEDISQVITEICNRELMAKFPKNLSKILYIDSVKDIVEDSND